MGLHNREGWLTNCLTVLESLWVIFTILLAIYIRQIAIVIAFFICLATGYNIQKRLIEKKTHSEIAAEYRTPQNESGGNGPTPPQHESTSGGGGGATLTKNTDSEIAAEYRYGRMQEPGNDSHPPPHDSSTGATSTSVSV